MSPGTEWQGEMAPCPHWTEGDNEARRRTDEKPRLQVTAMQRQSDSDLSTPVLGSLPPSPGRGDSTWGCLAARAHSYLVVLCPAVLDQVPHVVDLTGVAPASQRRVSE